MTRLEYWQKLNGFDWHYIFSDDSRTLLNGDKTRDELERLAEISAEHKALYFGFINWAFSGAPYSEKKNEKPPQPKERIQL